MENTISVFKNEKFGEVRTIAMNNDIYFVGKDVAEALGYAKPRNAIADHVDEDDALKQGLTDSLGRLQETTLINESGVYSLIFGSKLESAKEFKHWVTSEVLPSIRKNGMYAMDELLENPDLLVETAIKLRDEKRRRLEAEKKSQKLEIKLDESKEWYSVKRMKKKLSA